MGESSFSLQRLLWTGPWENQNNMPLENKYGYNGKEEISGIGLLDYDKGVGNMKGSVFKEGNM